MVEYLPTRLNFPPYKVAKRDDKYQYPLPF
jgi:hypothetical protein